MGKHSLYELLKVPEDANPKQLRKAYYALARAVHPDKRPGDPDAEKNFLALKRAYDILSDPKKRARYDRTGSVSEAEADAFEAAYEKYSGVRVTEADVESFVSGYRGGAEEKADVLAYATTRAGDLSRILEHVVASRDDDGPRFRAMVLGALDAGELDAGLRAAVEASVILTTDELDDGEDLGSEDSEDEDEEESEEEEDDEDPEAKIDLVDDPRPAAGGADNDLLAMFAARRKEREGAFDAFADKWAKISAKESKAASRKKTAAKKTGGKRRR